MRLKLFLISFLINLPFWWGINILQKNLEDFFLAQEFAKNPPPVFIAYITQNYSKNSESPEYSVKENIQSHQVLAESAISVELDQQGNEMVLFKKAENQQVPIASLTKLMTAIVASEFYYDSERIKISKKAVNQEEEYGNLRVGEILRVKDLMAIMLIESSNDAAFALAEPMGIAGFTDLMNLEARRSMGLDNSYFFNPTGLEPDNARKEINYSTAKDLVKLAKYVLKNPLILDIISKKEYPLYLENGVLHHILHNTNELLGEIPEIIGGKTGWTEKAGGCLVLILNGKQPQTYLINVVLNSPDRFGDMKKLINLYY